MTREAFASIRHVLKPGGALVINSFASFAPESDFLGQSLSRTLRDVFGNVRVYGIFGHNTMYVASTRAPLQPLREPDLENIHPDCLQATRDIFQSPIEPDYSRGILLTDDYNPSEFRDAANREALRLNMARYSKRF